MFDLEGFVGEIDEQHLHLTTVVGVDGAGTVEYSDAVFEGQAAAGADLCLAIFRQLDEEARGHQLALAGIQGQRLGKVGPQVKAGGHRRLVCRQRIIGCVEYLANGHSRRICGCVFEAAKIQKNEIVPQKTFCLMETIDYLEFLFIFAGENL